MSDTERLIGEAIDAARPRHLRRRAALLLSIPEEDRGAVSLAANRMVNLTGGRHSDALESTVAAYRRDREGFMEQRRRDQEETRRVQELERASGFYGRGLAAFEAGA